METQRCVTAAILDQANPTELLRNYPALASVVKDNVTVDIPQSELPAWAELVGRLQDTGSIRSLPITNKVVKVADPDFALIRRLVRSAIDPAPSPTPTRTRSTPTAEPSDSPSPSTSPSEPTDQVEDIAATC